MRQYEFFKILERRLSVIEDSERNDILDEYRQHIAMKMSEGGISEEKAIEDFGDVNALADDILSAYHVRIDASQSSNAIEKSKELFKNVKKETEPICKEAKSFWTKKKDSFLNFCKSLKTSVCSLFKREKHENADKGEKRMSRFGKTVSGIAKTLLKWINNLIFGGLSFITAVICAILLISFGILLVCSIIGYPFWGMTVITLGVLLVLGALSFAEYLLIKRKPKNNSEGEIENA